MEKRRRRKFTAEYKAEVVRLVRDGGKTIGQVSRDLGLTESAVRHWVTQSEIDAGGGGTGALTTAERAELVALRREARQLRGAGDPKKGGGLLREGEPVKFGFIQTEKALYPVRALCRTLLVSAAGFYAWCRRGQSLRAQQDAALRVEIRAAHAASSKRYGSPRIHAELQADGHRVGRKRVARLMREDGIEGQRKRRFRVTTDSRHSHPIAANQLQRNFTAPAPNKVWVTDITYIWTREGWLYLAAILDLYSRRVVGWSMDSCIDRGLALDALGMALKTRRPEPGLLHHSDRGVQYASTEYQSQLRTHGMICSMSRKGDCWDNAVAESFFSTLKAELVHRSDYVSRSQAHASVFEYIEAFYNGRRRHSALGFTSPVEHEAAAARKALAA